jgi:hypothetical protein
MAEIIKVSSFADLENLNQQKQAVLGMVDEIVNKIKSVSGLEVKLSGAQSSKEVMALTSQLTKSQQDLTRSVNEYEKAVANQGQTAKTTAQILKEKAAAEKLEAQALKELALAAKAEAQAVKEGNAAKKEAAAAEKEAAAARALDAKATKELAAADLLATKSSTEIAKAKQIEQKMTQALAKEKDKLDRSTQNELKNQAKLLSAYQQLKTKYEVAANSAKNFGAEQGVNSADFLEAASAAQKYYQQLIAIETAVGQSQRKVGQYENATFALSQTLRELPSFAYSVQTGILGISNNIPILMDQFAAVRESTGSTAKALQIFGGSIFGVTNLITIGIGLLTIFAGKIFNTGSETEKANIHLKEYEAVTEKIHKNLEQVNAQVEQGAKLGKVNVEVDNTAVPTLKAMNRDLLELQAQMVDAGIKSAALADGIKVLQANFRKAYADFLDNASDKAKEAEIGGTIEAVLSDLSQKDQAYYNAVKDAQKALTETQIAEGKVGDERAIQARDLAHKRAEIAKEEADQRRQLLFESAQTEVDLEKKKNEVVLANDRSTLGDRLQAIASNLQAEKRLIEATKQNTLTDPTASDTDRAIAIKRAASDAVKAELDYQTEIVRIKKNSCFGTWRRKTKPTRQKRS